MDATRHGELGVAVGSRQRENEKKAGTKPQQSPRLLVLVPGAASNFIPNILFLFYISKCRIRVYQHEYHREGLFPD